MKLLYLDFNGVLHDSMVMRNRKRGLYLAKADRSFFEWMPILDDLLAPYPDVQIVLSTSWVRAVSFDTAKYDLSPTLQSRVIGSTFHHPGLLQTAFDTMPRGMQILGDVERRKPASWFAIDDDAFGWPAAHRSRLVETRGDLGLSDPAAQDAVRAMLAAL
ncbi:HAD domain-containing protein [Actimicrobium antarcticum]|uniref:FCP1 homology domain-containing protein n=1 Tax=Actimicrobium antarcticum TaxID=1051899 RepID=A0ABP7SW73_9BURK